MAPIKLSRKSRLKFGLYCYRQETCKLTFSLHVTITKFDEELDCIDEDCSGDTDVNSLLHFQISHSCNSHSQMSHFQFSRFHTFNFHNSHFHTFNFNLMMSWMMLMVVMLTVWDSGRTFLCCPVCDFNHPPTRQSKDPIAPPHAHADTYHLTEFQEFFGEKKSDVSPKREALRYKFNQGHHSKGFRCRILFFGHASDGIWIVETKMPAGFT